MNLVTKLAVTALAALPLAACGGAPDSAAESSEAPIVLICPACNLAPAPQIAYSEWYQYQIHTHNTASGADVALPLYGRHPVLSPDRSKVAFVPTDGNIYVASAKDGSGQVKLTSSGGFDAPSWSPDGSQLVFASVGTAGYAADIYKVPAAGGSIVRLTANGSASYPTWYFNPKFLNASTVVFQVDLTGQASFGLVSIQASNQSSINYLGVGGGLGDLSVSPDGTKVAFTKLHGSCGRQAVVIGNVSGTTVTNLHELICSPNDDSNYPSIGAGGLVAYQWGAPYGTKTVFTLPSGGGTSKSQGISADAYSLDMSIQ